MALSFAARAEGTTVRDVIARLRQVARLMAAVGEAIPRVATREALARARQRASLVPDLLVDARRVVNTGDRRMAWPAQTRAFGENFWQFRPYVEGEALSRIDWRRSARDDHTYVARPRMGGGAHGLALGRPLAFDALQIDGGRGLQGIARPRSHPGPGRAPVALGRTNRLARTHRSDLDTQRPPAERLASLLLQDAGAAGPGPS